MPGEVAHDTDLWTNAALGANLAAMSDRAIRLALAWGVGFGLFVVVATALYILVTWVASVIGPEPLAVILSLGVVVAFVVAFVEWKTS